MSTRIRQVSSNAADWGGMNGRSLAMRDRMASLGVSDDESRRRIDGHRTLSPTLS